MAGWRRVEAALFLLRPLRAAVMCSMVCVGEDKDNALICARGIIGARLTGARIHDVERVTLKEVSVKFKQTPTRHKSELARLFL